MGWYHTGPKLHRSDIAIQELVSRYCPNPVLVIVDPKPKDFGLPTDAYYAVEEVHDVSGRVHRLYCGDACCKWVGVVPCREMCAVEVCQQLYKRCVVLEACHCRIWNEVV